MLCLCLPLPSPSHFQPYTRRMTTATPSTQHFEVSQIFDTWISHIASALLYSDGNRDVALGCTALRCYISFGLLQACFTPSSRSLPTTWNSKALWQSPPSGQRRCGISVVAWGLLHTGHSLPALPVATLQNFPTTEALLESWEMRFPSLGASPLQPMMFPAPSLLKQLLLPHYHS